MVSFSYDKNNTVSNVALGIAATGLTVLAAVACKRSVSSISKNIAQTKKFKAFNNMKEFSHLTRKQKMQCYPLLNREAPCILPTIRSVKPACTFGIKNKQELNAVINLNKGVYNNHLDFIRTVRNKNGKFSVNILNRNEVFRVIEQNREVFIKRLGLPINTATENIYKEVCNTLHYNVIDSQKLDIMGLTLGYPKYSSMIFNLEHLGGIPSQLRENPLEYKKALLKILNSEKSPYQNLSQTEKDKLLSAINSIEKIENNPFGKIYPFVNYTPEPEELQRISQTVENFRTINPELYDLCIKA